jgi:hypothetical protein
VWSFSLGTPGLAQEKNIKKKKNKKIKVEMKGVLHLLT